MAYYLEIRDDQCSHKTEMGGNEVDGPPSIASIEAECEEWVRDGEWGNDGASVNVWWTLTDEDGDEVDTGSHTVEVEPDQDALIKAAGGDVDCDHDWSGEGEGGCDENPGVWSVGGTAIVTVRHCTECGLIRKMRCTGSQRNPGEHDTVEYTMPETADAE